jgi:hypothetical protein
MMQTESESATGAVSDRTAVYYVVPIMPDTGQTESVLYGFIAAGKWIDVKPDDLCSRRAGCTANQVTLQQLSGMPGSDITGMNFHAGQIDGTVQLFAGIARTLGVDPDPVPTSRYGATGGMLTIPVEPLTTRGLILVFTKTPEPGMPPDKITQLIATTDPEIKGGVGTGGD